MGVVQSQVVDDLEFFEYALEHRPDAGGVVSPRPVVELSGMIMMGIMNSLNISLQNM
jgi:hypothetical protein